MKQLFIILAILAFGFQSCHSQTTVKKDASGKYVSVKISKSDSVTKKSIGTYVDNKGIEYPMYQSVNGKAYIIRVSKRTGNEYKQYLKVSN